MTSLIDGGSRSSLDAWGYLTPQLGPFAGTRARDGSDDPVRDTARKVLGPFLDGLVGHSDMLGD